MPETSKKRANKPKIKCENKMVGSTLSNGGWEKSVSNRHSG